MDNAIALLNRVATSENEFGIIVANPLQGCIFPIFGRFVGHDGHRHLGVGVVGVSMPEDEVAFKRTDSTDTGGIAVGSGVNVNGILKCRTVINSVVGVGGKIKSKVGQVELLLSAY